MFRSVCMLVRQKWFSSGSCRQHTVNLGHAEFTNAAPEEDTVTKLDEETVFKPSGKPSERYLKFKEKLRSDAPLICIPKGVAHPAHEKEPLEPWPNNTNPHTGEIGGPRGPEPTRYGDWESKGRVTDF